MTQEILVDDYRFNGISNPPALASVLAGPWASKITGTGPTVSQVAGGGMALAMNATSEVQNLCLYFGDILSYPISKLVSVEYWAMVSASLAAAVTASFGITNARNDAIASITQRTDVDSSAVDILLIGEVDVHSFREEKNYVIDVAFQQVDKPLAEEQAPAAAHAAAPARSKVAAQIAAVQVAHGKPLNESMPPQQPPELPPVTSEAIAEQAKIEIKAGEAHPPTASEQAAPASDKAPPFAEPEAPAAEKSAPAAEQSAPAAEHTAPAAGTAVEKKAATSEKAAPAEAGKAAQSSEATHAPAAEAPRAAASKQVPAAAAAAPKKGEPAAASVEARRDSDGLRVTFSFAAPTPAAMFRRADTVWLVFDRTGGIDVEAIRAKGGSIIGDVSRLPLEKGQAIRMRLNRPQMPSLESDGRTGGTDWTLIFADRVQAAPLPLMVLRNITDPALANVSVPLANPGLLHKLVDPDAGDTLLVVTAPPPTRGFIKRQDFVELSLLESVHGVVAHPNSDDVTAEVGSDKVMFGKPGGLTLSSADVAAERATAAVRPLFDANEWRTNRDENFTARLDALIKAMATATSEGLPRARLELANFYMARGMFHEARGVTNLILSETKVGSEEAAVVMVHPGHEHRQNHHPQKQRRAARKVLHIPPPALVVPHRVGAPDHQRTSCSASAARHFLRRH
jgi:hypothetical protein